MLTTRLLESGGSMCVLQHGCAESLLVFLFLCVAAITNGFV
jgi:hypothetical protein